MRKKFTNYKSSELYDRGYNYGMKMASEDIEKGNEKQSSYEEKTMYIMGLNDGYNDYYRSYEKIKVLKKSH